jgi:hypothetical protein
MRDAQRTACLKRKQVTQVEVIKDIVRLNNVRNSFDVIDPETGEQGEVVIVLSCPINVNC